MSRCTSCGQIVLDVPFPNADTPIINLSTASSEEARRYLQIQISKIENAYGAELNILHRRVLELERRGDGR